MRFVRTTLGLLSTVLTIVTVNDSANDHLLRQTQLPDSGDIEFFGGNYIDSTYADART